MQFRLSTSGIALESVVGGIRVSADRDVILDQAGLDELYRAVSMARTLMVELSGPVAETAMAEPPAAPAAAPVAAARVALVPVAAAPVARAPVAAAPVAPAVHAIPVAAAHGHEGPIKRGPVQSAARAGIGGRGIPRERVPVPHTAPRPVPHRSAPAANPAAPKVGRPSNSRQRGALVKHMVDWLTENPGRHSVDAIVAAAEAGLWSKAKALRPAVIAALRRSRHKIQRHPNNTFGLVAPPRAGRVVRRQRTR